MPATTREPTPGGTCSSRYDMAFAGLRPRSRSSRGPERLLGSISLMRLAWEHRRGEVGYWLAPAAAGGPRHARRRLICRWGFAALGLERIDLLAATGNLASQRVAERAGFTREAVLRSYIAARRAAGHGRLRTAGARAPAPSRRTSAGEASEASRQPLPGLG